jgi:vacuole morphology and inheritance protein 14
MYNIAKVAKGEILLYFNEVFDALCKVIAPPKIEELKVGYQYLRYE